MLTYVKQELRKKVGDKKLVDNLFLAFQRISEKYVAQKPVDLFQNVGLFVESALRVAEHIVLAHHTPLSSKFIIDQVVESLEKASGPDGLRIHTPRLCRSIYDFRSRKKSVHLTNVDPQLIDASLCFNICTWVIIEILKESGIHKAESMVKLLFTRKIPLVQAVGGVLRTTNPKLTGPQRLLILLYSAPDGLVEKDLLEGTKHKIKDQNHLKMNLRNMEAKDLIHKLPSGEWILFGQGYSKAEKLIEDFISAK